VEDNQNSKRILIVGGGFVGLTLAAKLLKNLNSYVIVLEKNTKKIEEFLIHEYGVYEPGLNSIFKDARECNRLHFVQTLGELPVDIVFICINTSKNELNRHDSLISVIEGLFYNIVRNGYIFLRSTVPVGTTTIVKNYLVKSDRSDLRISFAPERTVEGIALKELDSLPQLVGSTDYDSLEIGTRILESFKFSIIQTSNSEVAEFIKLMSNIWRDSTFAIANEFALFAESLNLNIFEILEKANFDYPRAGIPYPGPVGGPCLSKDTYLFLESFKGETNNDSIIYKARKQNEKITTIAFQKIIKFIDVNLAKKKILIIGGAFKGKPRTNDIRSGFTQELVKMLRGHQLQVAIWDPTLLPRDLLVDADCYTTSLDFETYDVVVIGNNANFILEEPVVNFLLNLPNATLIIDMWGATKNLDIKAKIYRYGVGI